MNYVKSIFSKITADKVRASQLSDAEVLHLEHAAAAEHHKAMADMYKNRICRLKEADGQIRNSSVAGGTLPR